MGIRAIASDFLSRILRGDGNTRAPNGGNTKSGARVTNLTAIENPAIRAAMRVLAEDVATVPRHLLRKVEAGKERAEDHWLYDLLRDNPNPNMTGVEYRELEMFNLAGWGNSYAYIELDPVFGAVPVALWPLRPDRMSVIMRPDGRRQYAYAAPEGDFEIFSPDEIVHVMGLSDDGIVGQSPLALHAEAIGLHIAVQDYASTYFSQGGLWGGFIIHPGTLSDDAIDKLKSKINDDSGSRMAHRWKVLREDMKVQTVSGMSPTESQMLETRRFSVEEVCRIFRLPPDKLGDLSHATYSNIEQQATNYVVYSLRPWLVRIEAAYNKRLVQPYGYEDGLVLEHNIDGLMRGDLASRYAAYAVGRQWGWYSVNDIRAKENENPVPEGDMRLVPMNMAPASAPEPPMESPAV